MKNIIKHFILALFFLFICGCVSTFHRNSAQGTVLSPSGVKKYLSQSEAEQSATGKVEQPQDVDIFWRQLQLLSLPELNQQLNQDSSSLSKGWVQLAIAAKQYANQPDNLVSAILAWQLNYADHPANLILPSSSALQQVAKGNNFFQMALLLPLHGPFGAMGQAVRDGFMTAFYGMRQASAKMPTVKIYDTSQTADVRSLYLKAIQEGAQLVVGPLTKAEVGQLMGADISVPTIVLNYEDSSKISANLVQFGLSSDAATEQAADQAWRRHMRRLLVITSQDDWGNRISQVFVHRWQQLGGDVVKAISVNAHDDLNVKIQALLNVDQSDQRAKALSGLLNESVKTVARRRQDVDGIFIAMNPQLARQVCPLLRFYYAGNLPLFSISAIYNGYDEINANQDLDGVQFDDIPWLFEENPLRSKIQVLWPTNYRQNSRLYALGIDAYQLATLFNRITLMPNFVVHGVSGDLFLNNQQQAIQQLVWAIFKNGKAVEMA